MPTLPLEGRVALVTGANHGIGAAIAVELARLGADVAVAYLARSPQTQPPGRSAGFSTARAADGAATVAAVEALGCRGLAVEADLSDPTAPRRLFDAAEAALGPVQVLVNNASAGDADSFLDGGADAVGRAAPLLAPATADPPLLVDARASALMIAELAQRSRCRGDGWGRIVGLTSGGPMGFPGEVSYGAAKAALDSFTMSASIELADLGITANVVHPPVTDTGWVTDEVRDFVRTSPDHVHVSAPEEVAEVVGWLCTDAARLVTGNVVRLR
jgi:3-oxoacyl-[acyl-carrier protein] reductase